MYGSDLEALLRPESLRAPAFNRPGPPEWTSSGAVDSAGLASRGRYYHDARVAVEETGVATGPYLKRSARSSCASRRFLLSSERIIRHGHHFSCIKCSRSEMYSMQYCTFNHHNSTLRSSLLRLKVVYCTAIVAMRKE